MSGTTLRLDLAGCRAALGSDDPDFLAYAAQHLATLQPVEPLPLAPATVSAFLQWHVGQPPRQRPPQVAQMDRCDRDIYADGRQLYWFRVDDLRDLHLRFTWADGRLEVRGDFYYRLGNTELSDRVRRALPGQRALRRRRYTTLLHYLVYYPCWWWLEHTQALHPIHAAGVLTDEGVILLAGASGVGKSSLAVALATASGARLLSDSFVLHHGSDVLAVREPLLLDAWSRRWLGGRADELQPIDWHYGLNRNGYHLPAGRLAPGGRAALLVFPRRAPKAYARRISAEEARRRLSTVDMIINDLRRYWAFAAVMEQLEPSGLMAQREAQIAALTAEVPSYEVGLTGELSGAAAADSILTLLQGGRLRAIGSCP